MKSINLHPILEETGNAVVRQRISGHPTPAMRTSRLSWLVLGLITLLYVAVSFTPTIFDDNEGLYTGAVREMHQRGDWLVPTTNGFPRVQKPPLVYWTMLVSTSLLGESEFAMRLPNALATAGWIVATYLIMRRLGGERFGLASALVLASMLGVWIFNHLVQPEPFLACFISLAVWCLVEARAVARPELFAGRWYLLFWVFLALGTMSKGLHGALWPLGTVALTALFVPTWRPWLRPVLDWRGVGLFLLIVIPWYAYMAARFPGFLAAHFINEQLGATLNTRYPVDAKQLSLEQFYGQHLIFWMPWTLLLPGAIYLAVKSVQAARRSPRFISPSALDVIKLLVIWCALTLVSVAFSTRQDYYSMSCWGLVAAFLATPWLAREMHAPRVPRPYLVVPCLCVAIGGLMALGLVAWVAPKLGSLGASSAAPIQERDTFMDAISGISPGLWGKFIALLGVFGVTMLIAGSVSTVLAWRRRSFGALVVVAGAMAVPIILAAIGFTMMSSYFSLAESARAINREIATEPDAFVACDALPHTASSLFYYLNARVHWVNAPFNQDYAQKVLGEGRNYYWDDVALLAAWNSPHRVYLIIDQSQLAHWRTKLGRHMRTVDTSGTRMVLCNR